uniref:Uncharacterized protein n=1 Tax=Timema tahoe TaxID=61484 RepID=A0A7R9IN47_9NEOP|nr:unnamed protein product [Timema tahoe]
MAVFFERSYAFYVRSGQFRGQTSPLLPLTPSSLDNLVSFISERSWFLLPFQPELPTEYFLEEVKLLASGIITKRFQPELPTEYFLEEVKLPASGIITKSFQPELTTEYFLEEVKLPASGIIKKRFQPELPTEYFLEEVKLSASGIITKRFQPEWPTEYFLEFFGPTAWCVASKGSTDPHHLSHIYLNSDQSSHVEPSGRRLGLPQGESLPVFPDEERPLGRERERNSCLVRVNIVTRRVSLLPIPKQTIPIRHISGTTEYEMRNGKPALFTDCTRECKAGAPRRICYYRFVMELYQVMGVACGNCSEGVMSDCLRPQCVTADGIPRGFLSIERMLESPSINVCKNDRIVVDLILMAYGFQECIHWHGLLQEGSQYYDGVPMLTQCAVQFPDSFRCPKSEEVNSHLYDYDHPNHTLSVTGWTHRPTTMDHHPGVVNRFSGIPSNLLFNGKGQYTSPDGITTRTPLAKFIVKRGKRYRFRFINSSSFICQIQIFIEDHNMTIIATDGEPCEPRTVDSIITSPASDITSVTVLGESPPNSRGWFRNHIQALRWKTAL